MMIKNLLVVASLFLPAVSMATPQKIEMIFLSPAKVTMILEQLDRNNTLLMKTKFAQNGSDNCVPMGEGCFHPQYGYMEKVEDASMKPKIMDEEAKKLELKTFNTLETNLVNCDKNNYFDIFCGKEKANSAPSEIEVWFDISSSLRSVDYNKDPDQCARRTFMEKVMAACKSKINVSVYNTSIKQIGDHSGACAAHGTNDQSRLLGWMKNSKARSLLIVTDIDEMSMEMRNFLESNGAKMKGDGVKNFTSADLIDYAKDFIKMCR